MYGATINGVLAEICDVNNVRDDKYIKAFGENLREIRLAKKKSQEYLGESAKLSKNQIGRIERGEVNVTISTIKRIAKSLSIHPKELFDF